MEIIRNNAAYIIHRINEIWKSQPGKKTLQKLVFLIKVSTESGEKNRAVPPVGKT